MTSDFTAALTLLAGAIAPIAASPFVDLPTLDGAVARFVGVAVGEPGGALQPIDRRLKLRPCATDPALSWRTPARDAVVVECPDAGSWRLFVPLRAAAAAALASPPAVLRGDAVSIAVEGDGFTVSQPGEALEAGIVGEWVRVRPAGAVTASREPMRARVVRPGLVSVPLG